MTDFIGVTDVYKTEGSWRRMHSIFVNFRTERNWTNWKWLLDVRSSPLSMNIIFVTFETHDMIILDILSVIFQFEILKLIWIGMNSRLNAKTKEINTYYC